MRLLKRLPNGDFELVTFNTDNLPPYAILSHTWTEGQEVTYNELVAGTNKYKEKAGYTKIRFCGERAAADRLEYFWVDTCCIDKSTSEELNTAINSMFRWYQHASKCYVYLPDVEVPVEVIDVEASRITWENSFRRSRWFTRGWTLQELLAPASVEFFSKEGKRLGSKISLGQEIYEITEISIEALRGKSLSEFSIEERMGWAAKRRTTVQEDRVYCLLGIFEVFLPLIYGEGEKYASSRLRKEILETRRYGERGKESFWNLPDESQALAKPVSSVPFRKDDDFVDRGDILSRIDERCSRLAGRVALVGFGGFGKSQLAIEYAHRVRKRSPDMWIFWVHASNSARLEEGFRDIAERVGVSSQPGAAVDIIQLVRKWLRNEANGRWLMIVDNVDYEISVETQTNGQRISLTSLLPQSDNGAILITSRNGDVARSLVGREQDIIAVGAMSGSEAVQLLQNKLGYTPGEGARELVDAVECIPLAIAQAAAYISRLQATMSVAKYLTELKVSEKRTQLLHKATFDMRRDEQASSSSVFTTWQVSFDYICKKRPSAANMLSFISFFNRQGIPEFMVRHYADAERTIQSDILGTPTEEERLDFGEDMAILRAFSLVNTQCEGEFEMHGLVQLATRIWLKSIDAEERWHETFIQAMAQEFPDGKYENWPKCRALFPHVLSVIEQGCLSNERSAEWALLLHNASWYALQQGLFTRAEDMVTAALDIQKEALDADSPGVTSSLELLALILTKSGKYDGAEAIFRQNLAISEKLLGAEHLDTLKSMANLALVLRRRGKYEEAEVTNRQNLAISEKVLGVEHLNTLASMTNLAAVLHGRGKYEEAESMNRQALARQEKVLGVEHPNTLASIGNLALVLRARGKYEEAESMTRQALAWREKVLGAEHPDTLTSMADLANILHEQGKYKEAESINRQTLARREKVLGVEHPDTLISMANLAVVLDSNGKYEEAESITRQELAISEKVLGVEHPDTLMSMANLACVLDSENKYEEAESMNRQALAWREKVLGVDHPDTLISMSNLAGVLYELGKYEEVESMNRQTLARREKVLGVEHPDTLNSVHNLAYFLAHQHRYGEADVLYQRACAGFGAVLGKDHPTTSACYQLYSEMLALQEQNRLTLLPEIPTGSVSMHTGKGSRLWRGLAKVGIRSSKFSKK